MFTMFSTVIFAILLVGVLSSEDRKQPGQCPDYPGSSDFDFKRMEGEWFQIYTTRRDIRCRKSFFTVLSNGSATVQTSFNRRNNDTSIAITKNVTYTPVSGKKYAFTVNFARPEGGMYRRKMANFGNSTAYIIDTDYTNYRVTVSCINFKSDEYLVNVGIGSRVPTLADEFLNKAKDALKKVNVDVELNMVDQTNCSS